MLLPLGALWFLSFFLFSLSVFIFLFVFAIAVSLKNMYIISQRMPTRMDMPDKPPKDG